MLLLILDPSECLRTSTATLADDILIWWTYFGVREGLSCTCVFSTLHLFEHQSPGSFTYNVFVVQ